MKEINETSGLKPPTEPCPYCGHDHLPIACPRVKAVEFHSDGKTIKRVTFHQTPICIKHGGNR